MNRSLSVKGSPPSHPGGFRPQIPEAPRPREPRKQRPFLASLVRAPLVQLAACGLGAAAIYLVGFTLPYSLEGGLAKPLLQFARISGPSVGPTVGFVAAVAALFALYLAAVRLCRQLEGSRVALAVVLALGAAGAAVLLPMYPIFSLDIFYYMAADRIWSVYRENPFVVPPLQAAHDPFFPYTTWGHYPLPYGPLWPWITAAISAFGGGAVQPTLVAFKALAAGGYLACLPAVWWTVRAARPERQLTGLCIFAWNPLVLLELVGGGHNDPIALLAAALALGLWLRRASVPTALALTASLLVKATIAVALPGMAWAGFRRALDRRELPRWTLTHLAPAAALLAVAWLPFASGGAVLGVFREADQHYHSLTAVVMAALPPDLRPGALRVLQMLLLGLFGAYYLSQLRALAVEGLPALRALWRILVLYFLLVSPFYSGWYMIWPTLFAAVLAERRTTLLTALLCIGSLATYLVQFVIRPLTFPATISWLGINTIGVLAAFGPFLLGWGLLAWRDRKPHQELAPVAAEAR